MDIKKQLKIFVVEDNKIYNRVVCEYLKKQNFKQVTSFYSGKECIKTVAAGNSPHIVIQDYHLEDATGIDVLRSVKKISKRTEFVFLTGNEDMDVAVNTIKYGAYDYIIKDNDLALKKVVNKIEKIGRLFELQSGNRVVKQAMIISVLFLVLIVILSMLHILFNTFGITK
jgi:DNA-binding NtrC family response regulator